MASLLPNWLVAVIKNENKSGRRRPSLKVGEILAQRRPANGLEHESVISCDNVLTVAPKLQPTLTVLLSTAGVFGERWASRTQPVWAATAACAVPPDTMPAAIATTAVPAAALTLRLIMLDMGRLPDEDSCS